MRFIKWIIGFIKKSLNDNITVYAAQAAYYLVVSAVPMLIILLSAGVYFLPVDKYDIIKMIPDFASEDVEKFFVTIVSEIFERPRTSVISLSAAATLWSASRGVAAVERGIRAIYKIPKRQNYIKGVLISFLYTLLLTAIIILSVGVLGFGEMLINFIKSHTGENADFGMFLYILIFLVAVLVFTAVYTGFSARKISFLSNLPGGLFTSAGWILFSYAFSVYINNFANYPKIYGSLTVIVLLMLWVYFAMIILLFGAEINMEITEKR